MIRRVVTVSLRQQIVPSELLDRVNSAYRMLGWGLMPLGALAGGLVAHEFGIRAGYLAAGALRGVVLLAALPVLIAEGRTAAARRVRPVVASLAADRRDERKDDPS